MKNILFFAVVISTTTASYGAEPSNLMPCEHVIAITKKLKTNKDEFETTEDFNSRMSAITKIPISKTVSFGDELTFKIEGLSSPSISYNADEKELTTKMFLGAKIYKNTSSYNFINSNIKKVSSKSTTGINAFGVKKRIDIDKYHSCSLALTNALTNRTLSIQIIAKDISTETARSIKSNAGILISGYLQPPYYFSHDEFHGATIDSPTEVSWSYDMIPLKISKISIYNKKTNEVISEQSYQ